MLTMYKRINTRANGYLRKVDPILTDNLSNASNRSFFGDILVTPLAISVSELYDDDDSIT